MPPRILTVGFVFRSFKLTFLFLFAFSVSQLSAQTNLSGKIIDQNGKPLSQVNVFIPELKKGTVTDNNGAFHFQNLSKEVFTLQCSHVSYKSNIQTLNTSLEAGEITIVLQPKNKNLDEVIVNSTAAELNRNSPFTVSSLSHADLQKSGQTTLMESLAQKPGVDIISTGGIGKPVIRGLSFSKVSVFSMGTKIESQQWDDDHDAGIAEAGVDRAEIIYGPSALLYGPDAFGGTVIFLDEKSAPPGKTIGNVNLGLFSNTSGINVGGGIKHTYSSGIFYQAYINGQSHCDYRPGSKAGEESKPFAINSRFSNFDGKAKLGLIRNWGVSKLSYSYIHSLSGLVVDEAEDSAATADGHPYLSSSRKMMAPYFDVAIQVVSSENTFLSGHSKWNVTASYQANKRKEFMPEDPGQLALGLMLRTYSYDIKWTSDDEKKLGLTLGSQGMMQTNRNYGSIIATPDADVNDYAVYGLAHYNTGNWSFLSGLRIDSRDINVAKTNSLYEDGTTLDSLERLALDSSGLAKRVNDFHKHYYPFSFSSGVVYHPSTEVTIKSNIATGFSAPNFIELASYWKHEGTLKFEIGNPNLTPQQNIEADMNATMDFKNFSFYFSAFYNHMQNYIYLAPTRDTLYDLQVIEYDQKNAFIYGGEAGVYFHPQSAKWFQLNSTFCLNTGRLSDGGYLPYFPSNKVMSELKFASDSLGNLRSPYISFNMGNHFAQDHPALYETPTNGYTLFDVNIGTDFKIGKQDVHAVLFCTNIFNTAYYNHLSLLKVIGVYDRGRNIGLKLNVPFGN